MTIESERTCKKCGTKMEFRNYRLVKWSAGPGAAICEECAKVIGIEPQKAMRP